jgi:hypothetical protein
VTVTEWLLLTVAVVGIGGGGFGVGVMLSPRAEADELSPAGRVVPWVLLAVGVACVVIVTGLRADS